MPLGDWAKPESLSREDLIGFLLNEHLTHSIGMRYADGADDVDAIYREIASRIKKENKDDQGN